MKAEPTPDRPYRPCRALPVVAVDVHRGHPRLELGIDPP